jgi:hypothetical protein
MGNNRYDAREISPRPPEGSTSPGRAGRLEELEAENVRLKDVVALLTLDKLILEEVAEENSRGYAQKSLSGDEQ